MPERFFTKNKEQTGDQKLYSKVFNLNVYDDSIESLKETIKRVPKNQKIMIMLPQQLKEKNLKESEEK